MHNWLSKDKHGSMKWLYNRRDERSNIFKYFNNAKSVISVGLNYYHGISQDDLKSDYKFSNYAWGTDYHNILKTKLRLLLQWIKDQNKEINGIVCSDTSPVMEKAWSQRSGLGWIGKHTNLITIDFGSWVFLGELILDVILEYDSPFYEDLCGSCTACIDSCPTQALDEYELDSRKCISYLNIEYRGEFPENNDDLHGWIYGCDICQEVCPWNIKFSQFSAENSFKPRYEIKNYSNQDWDNLSKDDYKKIFKESAIKRTKYEGLKRNIENAKNK